jgi:flagellar biosynthesis/type III secretory pathway protein FliH
VLAQAADNAEEATMVDTSEARAVIERVRNEGLAEGRSEGLAKGLERGLEAGLEAGLRPLVRQFERRLGRVLSEAERGALASRLDVVGPERLGDVVLDLDSAALAAWLASPTAT